MYILFISVKWSTAKISTRVFLLTGVDEEQLAIFEGDLECSIKNYGAIWYRAINGNLEKVRSRGFKKVAMNAMFVIGVRLSQNTHQVFDAEKKQIFLGRISHYSPVKVTAQGHEQYDRYFVSLTTPPTSPLSHRIIPSLSRRSNSRK